MFIRAKGARNIRIDGEAMGRPAKNGCISVFVAIVLSCIGKAK